MNGYIKITGRTFTMWLLACVINGLLCGAFVSIIDGDYSNVFERIIGYAFISLFFAIPGFIILWLVLLFRLSTTKKDRSVFRTALVAGFILACITALFVSNIFSSEFSDYHQVPSACIILSALSSVMLHFKYLKNIN